MMQPAVGGVDTQAGSQQGGEEGEESPKPSFFMLVLLRSEQTRPLLPICTAQACSLQ